MAPPVGPVHPGWCTGTFGEAGAARGDGATTAMASPEVLGPHHLVVPRGEGGGPAGEEVAPPRHVRPSELDLASRLAGMRLRHRRPGWDRAAPGAEGTSDVSVRERPRP